MTTIEINKIGKKVENKYLFQDLSFTASSGEMIAITGDSGCGKTTLLNCIGQLENLSAGSISINGEIIHKKNRKFFFKHTVGFLFQNFGLIDNETVSKNLEIATNNKDSIVTWLKYFNIEPLLNLPIYKISGGEQQRVALIRTILKDPILILADEPTASLDETNRDLVINELRKLSKKGKIVIVVTHDKNILSQFDKIIKLNNGKITM